VKITKNGITVDGNGATVKPTTVTSGTDQGSPCSGGTGTAIVLVSGVTGVTLNDLNVDGQPAGGSSPARYVGIYYRNASGAINGGTVQDIRDNPLDGVQIGLGILAQANSPNTAALDVSGVTVIGYQKNGVTFNGCGCADTPDGVATGSLTNSTITGAGPTDQIAQNGVQVGFGAGPVTISGNQISGNAYTGDPNNGTGAGVLLFSTKNDVVTTNVVRTNNNGVAIAGGDFSLCSPGDSTGHTVTCNSIQNNAINNTVGSPAAGPGVLSDAANNTIHMNLIQGNEVGANGTAISSGQLDAEDNWWGCPNGPVRPAATPWSATSTSPRSRARRPHACRRRRPSTSPSCACRPTARLQVTAARFSPRVTSSRARRRR
jgi:hypothetical protein